MTQKHEISVEGNGFIRQYGEEGEAFEQITNFGIQNWRNPETLWAIYFYVSDPDDIIVSAKVRGPKNHSSVIRVSLEGTSQSYEIPIQGDEEQVKLIGLFRIEKSGYVQLNFQGISRTGTFFTDITSINFAYPGEIWYIKDDVYFGRRGPSVHFQYLQNPGKNYEYFYNEVMVPTGNDVIGAYYAVSAFDGGYFGIQVNGTRERRILFSVWSDFDTDDPDQIPEEYKVVPIKNGRNVHVGEFGNEGSGAQSYLRYPWKVDETYKFLVKIVPLDDDNTEYTSWIQTPEYPQLWQLISSFRKPKVSIYTRGLYCFSENFIPEQGYIERKVVFKNHWACDIGGNWDEITRVRFTADETSRISRKDISAGLDDQGVNGFMLRNCGFFSNRVEAGVEFERPPGQNPPEIDFDNLP